MPPQEGNFSLLLDEQQRKYLTVNKFISLGSNGSFGNPSRKDEKVADMTGLFVGISCLMGVAIIMKGRQRTTTKFFNSLNKAYVNNLFKVNYTVLPRDTVGIDKHSETLDLLRAKKAVILIGDNRSGKTSFICNNAINEFYPWWFSFICPPRGLYLDGTTNMAPTIEAWLKNQISTTERDNPWLTIRDVLSQRYNEQRIRLLLHQIFKTKLPVVLKPQPVIIVVDHAEELLRSYRTDVLISFHNLVKQARDVDLFRLVLIVRTENAVKSLMLINGGNMFDVIKAPKVSREAIVVQYGKDFAQVFDDCDHCIGIALDYFSDRNRSKHMTAKEYAKKRKDENYKIYCLRKEITREEYVEARKPKAL